MGHGGLKHRVTGMTGLFPSAVAPTAVISPEAAVERSVIGEGCTVMAGAEVSESVLLPGCTVKPGERMVRSVAVRDGLVISA